MKACCYCFFLIFLASCQFDQEQEKENNAVDKSNVLFIAVDDLNDWIGALNNHPDVLTPNIDRLANNGLLFTKAYCQAPICAPSRTSIMTGLLPATSGIYLMINDNNIRESNEYTRQCTFLPDYFEQHGYKTFGVGKIFHQGDAAKVFDEYGGFFEKYGPIPKERMNYDPAWLNKPTNTSTDWGAFPAADSLMPDYKSAEWAVKQLTQKQDKPFFLTVGFIRPHVPWHVPQKWFNMFDPDTLATPPYNKNDFDDIPEIGAIVAGVPMMPTTEWALKENKWRDIIQAYLASIAFVDHQIGKVLDALQKSAYADNTFIVLWSDHGYHLGEKNRFAKVALWERAIHVPLIFAGPGIKKNTISDAPVGLIDLYPTLLDLCGLPENKQNDGRSLRPLLNNPKADWPYFAMTSFGRSNYSVIGKQHHYIHYEGGAEEFYDLKNDPNEWNNLVGKADNQEIITMMKKQLPEKYAPLASKSSYSGNDYFGKESKSK